MDYDFKAIEKKWQKRWEEKKVFQVKESNKKEKFYVLDMFPYPSGEGLHMGHAFVYTLGDIFARFKRLRGYNVLYPIGFDSLGLPAENAAIKAGVHPERYTKKAIANFIRQQKMMGWSYDWSRMVKSSDSGFYGWDQWIFLKMLEKGIAYRKKAPVNWCPKCNTVLANEQVVSGKCWRHDDTDIEIKHLEQWFFRITNYAEDLLKGLEKIDWPERAKIMQRNWIGKSSGTEILFEINGKKWPIFTTRPDTIFGVTFMVVSAQHPELMSLVTEKQKKEVEKFLKKLKSTSEKEMIELEKEGVFTGSYATNPVNREKVPVYAGNFVVSDYGSGMVMAVPAHDQRDFGFAEKYALPIKVVIEPVDYEIYKRKGQIPQAYAGEGNLVNSGKFNGLESKRAREEITKFLAKKKSGKKVTQYKLKDWLISRQRYWGTPIPIIYCDKCGIVPVPEKDLPVKLPVKVKFGKGNPLATNEKWINTKCPRCRGSARRETDTMDTFVNSSWYFLRYCDSKNNKEIFDKEKVDYWTPIDQYIGGPEHITCHLIYIRFYTKFLKDLGLLDFDEPALRYFTQGVVKGMDGERMSKSKGNVIEPLETIKNYGADALRLYLISASSPEKDIDWSDEGIQGSLRFLKRVMNYFDKVQFGKSDARTDSKFNSTILEIEKHIEEFKYNFAVIALRELFESLPDKTSKTILGNFLKLLSPFCPHITEELWEKLGNKAFLSLEKWPRADKSKINEFFERQDLATDKLISDINQIFKLVQGKERVYVYVFPNEKEIYEEELIRNKLGRSISIFAVNDKSKYDPANMSKKAKPGRPAIYLE